MAPDFDSRLDHGSRLDKASPSGSFNTTPFRSRWQCPLLAGSCMSSMTATGRSGYSDLSRIDGPLRTASCILSSIAKPYRSPGFLLLLLPAQNRAGKFGSRRMNNARQESPCRAERETFADLAILVAGLAAAWLCTSRAINIPARYQSRYYWADHSFDFLALYCRHLQFLCETEALT